MIETLDMHLLDLVQNAYSADATRVEIEWMCDESEDRLTLRVRDDGMGMEEETLNKIRRGFYSSKSNQSVGLGIPLLRETAEHCDGRFDLDSRRGAGTAISAVFRLSHIDRPPFGDLGKTFLSILVTSGRRRVSITYRCGGRSLFLDTEEIMRHLGDLSIQHPEVIRFLRAYIADHIGEGWEE